jgi:hypothetical protein
LSTASLGSCSLLLCLIWSRFNFSVGIFFRIFSIFLSERESCDKKSRSQKSWACDELAYSQRTTDESSSFFSPLIPISTHRVSSLSSLGYKYGKWTFFYFSRFEVVDKFGFNWVWKINKKKTANRVKNFGELLHKFWVNLYRKDKKKIVWKIVILNFMSKW